MRKILEDLIFLGAAEETVKLYGKDWTLRTLTSDEHLAATNATGEYDTLSRIYALKMEIVGRALKGVDDITITGVPEGLELVKRLQPPIVNKLYDEYEKLQQKQTESLSSLDEIKNS
jgi:hypothetical protein